MNENDQDKKLNKHLNTILDFMGLSLLFVICSLPILTIGAAFTALSGCCMEKHITKEEFICKKFFEKFKGYLKRSTPVWIMLVLLLVIFGFMVWFAIKGSGADNAVISNTLLSVGVVVLCLVVMECMYVFAIQAKFHNKLKREIQTAFILSIKYFPVTILLAFVMSIITLLLYFKPTITFPVMILIGVGALGYFYGYFMLKCFEPYLAPLYDDEPDTSKEHEPGYTEDAATFMDAGSEKLVKGVEGSVMPKENHKEKIGDKVINTDAQAPSDAEKQMDETEHIALIEFDFEDKDIETEKKNSIQLSDALEDEKRRIEEANKAIEEARRQAEKLADKKARETAEKLANKVKEEQSYKTAGENIYRRASKEDKTGKLQSRGKTTKKKQRKI